MASDLRPSHVAILVPSVRRAADYLSQFGFQIGAEEIWEGEGTKEIYVEKEKPNSLLLMEPYKPGAYRRALEKRGPGLHHMAIDVLNLESYVESLSGSGWLLHPSSVKTMKKTQTAYLARPGFPGLIEVQERKELATGRPFVREVALKFDAALEALLKYVGLESIVKRSAESSLVLGHQTIQLAKLF